MRALIAAIFVVALFALALFYEASAVSPLSYGASIGSGNYTASSAKAFIDSASAYINSINQSGYLIFMPNLTASYKYLDEAKSTYNTSPDTAVIYANKAIESAKLSYMQISYYKSYSFVVLVVFTVAIGALLYKLMKPIKRRSRRQ